MAHKTDMPFSVVAAVCAALSPRCKWEQNLVDTMTVLTAVQHGLPEYECKVTTYGRNKSKAFSIAHFRDPALLSGPKVTAFYSNLMGDYHTLTLDTHAITAWKGNNRKPSRPDFRKARAAYHRAAKKAGIPVALFQAVIWVIQREG
jgi:hypothetical protein